MCFLSIISLHSHDNHTLSQDFHSSILAWEIPGTEEPGGLQSIELDTTKVA